MIKPTYGRILIEEILEEKKGIIIPDSAKEKKSGKGKVVEVGEGVEDIKKGDLVLFADYQPDRIKVDDKEYLFAKEDDIMATYE